MVDLLMMNNHNNSSLLIGTNIKQQQEKSSDFDRLYYELKTNPIRLKERTNGRLIGFYSVGDELGSGNFSQVKLGIHLLTREKVAIKILDKTKLDEKTQRLLFREITSMEKLHHPNIIRLYEVINTYKCLHICMEYAPLGDLYTRITEEGKLNETYARLLFSQIIGAIDHMHSHNIIHRDIKAENIFFASKKCIKLGDFGFSTNATQSQQLTTFCGSPPYAAPELFRDDSYIGMYVDIWAIGILLYFMCTSQMPFRADTVGRLKRCILSGEYTIPSHVSESCQLLIRGILKPVPSDRFTIRELMESAWLDDERFPEQLEPYQLNPSVEQSELKREEILSRKYMEKLGIGREVLLRHKVEDKIDIAKFQNNLILTSNSRSIQDDFDDNHSEFKNAINGTYRIIFHRIQKELRNHTEEQLYAFTRAQTTQSATTHTHTTTSPLKKSQTILSVRNLKTSDQDTAQETHQKQTTELFITNKRKQSLNNNDLRSRSLATTNGLTRRQSSIKKPLQAKISENVNLRKNSSKTILCSIL